MLGRQPFDGARQSVDAPEPVFDGADHQITDILALDALRRGNMAHGFAITAIEGEGDADLLLVVAGDLEAIRAPACVGMINRNPAVMAAFIRATSMALEEKAMRLHDVRVSVNPGHRFQ